MQTGAELLEAKKDRYFQERKDVACIMGAGAGAAGGLVGGVLSGNPVIVALSVIFGASVGCGGNVLATESSYKYRKQLIDDLIK